MHLLARSFLEFQAAKQHLDTVKRERPKTVSVYLDHATKDRTGFVSVHADIKQPGAKGRSQFIQTRAIVIKWRIAPIRREVTKRRNHA